MGVGAFLEPLVVVALLLGGTWVNRNTDYQLFQDRKPHWTEKHFESEDTESSGVSRSRLSLPFRERIAEPKWHVRKVKVLGVRFQVNSPNTRIFKGYFLSRVLLKFPFLVEVWYWALIYWVYQLGRAFTAVNLVEGTVDVARRHALQILHLEQKLHIFFEPAIQQTFLKHEVLMHWINRIYTYIHIPGTIFFLVWLYYYTTVSNNMNERPLDECVAEARGSPAGSKLYEARRRTLALCNLLAFIIFTAWPCMPPRLLSDKSVKGPEGREARSYGFVDTVHGVDGESSVWTENRFCNQYAAMPSLHFGYALMIGLTVALIPLTLQHKRSSRSILLPMLHCRLRFISPQRTICVLVGFAYSFIIFVAIISTANHFILDAVAGACICAAGWWGNSVLLNLLIVEDYFLWCVRIHKPQRLAVEEVFEDEGSDLMVEGALGR